VCLDQPVPPHSSSRAAVGLKPRRGHTFGLNVAWLLTGARTSAVRHCPGWAGADLRAESTRAITDLPFDGYLHRRAGRR
jgi:hypothetical protein